MFMLEKLKKKTLWVGLIGAGALIVDAVFGVQLGNEQIDKIAEGMAALMVVYGILVDHGSK